MTTLQTNQNESGYELSHDGKHVGNLNYDGTDGLWVPMIFGAVTTHRFKAVEAAEYYALAIFIEKQYSDRLEDEAS